MSGTPLGRIVRLQIQRSSLSTGEPPARTYGTGPIAAVDELILTAEGAMGRMPDGSVVIDIHHVRHPDSRNRKRGNDLSIGFTSHYAAIRGRYDGPHLADGCAGENILVETADRVGLERLSGDLRIRRSDGREIPLGRAAIAHPCQPFSRFVSRSSDVATVKSALQFLGGGLRGFYVALIEDGPAAIRRGDELLLK